MSATRQNETAKGTITRRAGNAKRESDAARKRATRQRETPEAKVARRERNAARLQHARTKLRRLRPLAAQAMPPMSATRQHETAEDTATLVQWLSTMFVHF